MKIKWQRGSELPHATKCEIFRRFVHRTLDTTVYKPQGDREREDQQWLAAHAFAVRADGSLDNRARRCMPAWWAETEATP